MSKKRSDPELAWLPSRVYKGKSAWEFHPKGGGAIRLGGFDESKEIILKRWDEHNNRLSAEEGETFSGLCGKFMASPQWIELAAGTRKKYEEHKKHVCKVFGRMHRKKIKPEHIRMYMDKRGETAKTTANREHAFMSKVFQWGYERGLVTINPCRGVRKFPERSRDRYITDDEYNLLYKFANTKLRAVMEISYLCAARVSDVLKFERKDILEEGLSIKQGKTGKKQIKEWTPRLKTAVKLAKSIGGIKSHRYLLSSNRGHKYAYQTFRNWWSDAMELARAEAEKKEWPPLDFTFHDIKAKGISDYEGTTAEKQDFSGHKTQAMVEKYDRKVKKVKTLNLPEIDEK